MPASGRNPIAGLILLLLQPFGAVAAAADEASPLLQLPNGQEIEVERFAGSGKSLLLWLPSERGFSAAYAEHARQLAQSGYEVWLADLHASYFISPGRRSIAQFPLDDVVGLIDAAVDAADGPVVLLSTSRGAQLSLIAAREWQRRNPGRVGIGGLFLTHAYLYEGRPEVGESASFLPIVAATNLPVYLLDAQYSTRSARVRDLASALGEAGSEVFVHIVPGVQGGFFARDDGELSAPDLAAKRDFAQIVDRGIRALGLVTPPVKAVPVTVDTRSFSHSRRSGSALKALPDPLPAPALNLPDYRGSDYRLEQRQEQVTLVNFWASWCKPCVEEIPSLHRLRARIADPGFAIVTVNVGESRARIENFLSRVTIDLPLLLDSDSQAAKAWKIYVYPSTYLVDHRGQIRYAYLGALEWDSAENIKLIRNLLRQR